MAPGVPAYRSCSFAIRLLTACLLLPAFRSATAQPVDLASSNSGSIDVHVADIFIRYVFTDHRADQYDRAARLYLDVLSAAATPLDSADQAILCRYLAQLAPVLPPQLHSRIRPTEADKQVSQGCTLSRQSADALVAWWRSQDPIPATERNERLIEHLERVNIAEKRYADEGRTAGYDGRGILYVRLGPPDHIVDHLVIAPEIKMGIKLVAGDELQGQYWVYTRLGHFARYVLVRNNGHYYLGSFMDLLPTYLRHGNFSSTGHDVEKAVKAMYLTYGHAKQLARYNLDFMFYLNAFENGIPPIFLRGS